MIRFIRLIFSLILVVILLQIFPSVALNIKEEYSTLFDNRVEMAHLKIDGSITEVDEFAKNLRGYFESKRVKAILINIESAGGIPGPCQALFKEIKSLKREHPTPVVIITNSTCTFSAYYIACAADYIVASPSALIGGISAYTEFNSIQNFVANWNMEKESNFPKIDKIDETEKLAQNIYKQFTKDIAISRKLSLKDTDKWANGNIFTGDQALAIKLVDELGSEFNAVRKMRELALVEKGQKIRWIKPRANSLINQIMGYCKI